MAASASAGAKGLTGGRPLGRLRERRSLPLKDPALVGAVSVWNEASAPCLAHALLLLEATASGPLLAAARPRAGGRHWALRGPALVGEDGPTCTARATRAIGGAGRAPHTDPRCDDLLGAQAGRRTRRRTRVPAVLTRTSPTARRRQAEMTRYKPAPEHKRADALANRPPPPPRERCIRGLRRRGRVS